MTPAEIANNKNNNDMEGSMIMSEVAPEPSGEFVRLVWLIEGVRNGRDCTMNELIGHCKKFFNIEDIKFKNPEHLAAEALQNHIDKVRVKK